MVCPAPLVVYIPIQEVVPKVVAIAVRTVMRMFRILFQRDLFSIVFLVYSFLVHN